MASASLLPQIRLLQESHVFAVIYLLLCEVPRSLLHLGDPLGGVELPERCPVVVSDVGPWNKADFVSRFSHSVAVIIVIAQADAKLSIKVSNIVYALARRYAG